METNRVQLRIFSIFLVLVLSTLACGLFSGGDSSPIEIPAEPLPESSEPDQPAIPPETQESLLGEEYTSLEGGFSFLQVPGYTVEDFFGFVKMSAPGADPDLGPSILLIGGLNEEQQTLAEFYDNIKQDIEEDEGNQLEFSHEREITIGGVPGKSVDLSGVVNGQEVEGRVVVAMVNPLHQFSMYAAAPKDRWDELSPLFEAVLGTLSFFEPVIEPEEPIENEPPEIETPEAVVPDSQAVPLGDEFTSTEGGYSFRVIDGFEVDDYRGNTSMVDPEEDMDSGPMVAMLSEALEEETTLDELYEAQISEITEEDVTLSAPRDEAIGGAPGRTVDISGTIDGTAVAGQISIVLVNPKQMFMIGGLTPADQWEEFSAFYEAVKASVSFVKPGSDEIRQWATYAFASSSYGDPDYHAVQATGKPDTLVDQCEDLPTAWASLGSDTIEWLELVYDTPVIPTEINIIQTHAPDQVVKVEVLDRSDTYHQVYSADPVDRWEECPYTLSIPVEVDYEVVGIKIAIDQSVIGIPWNEIDAVELVGVSAQEVGSQPPGQVETPSPLEEDLSLQDPPVPSDNTYDLSVRLMDLGYEICTPVDFFTVQTESAVKAFQQNNGLTVDGVVDSQMWDLLFSQVAIPQEWDAEELVFDQVLAGISGDLIASDGSLLWVLTQGYGYLEAFDPELADMAGIYSLVPLPGDENYLPSVFTYDEEKLWIGSQGMDEAVIQAYDLYYADPTEGLLYPLHSDSYKISDVAFLKGLSYDGSLLWIAYEGFSFPSGLIAVVPDTGEIIRTVEFGMEEYIGAPIFDGEQLWIPVEGYFGGQAIRSVDPEKGEIGDLLGICGFPLAYDGAALWVAKEDSLWVVDPFTGVVQAIAHFDQMVKSLTFSGARIYVLLWDDTIWFYQVW
jgi:peptidoglycan hydrolase-like protein with peptidoglycan-binding domain